MRWQPGEESRDVIDRRGERGGGGVGLGGGGGGLGLLFAILPWLLRTPFGWVILLVIVAVMIGGGVLRAIGGGADPGALHGDRSAEQRATPGQSAARPQDRQVQFVSFVLDDVQHTWDEKLPSFRPGTAYHHAKLVLFTDATSTACGAGRAAAGPFYCPGDERVYVDLGFFDELAQRFGAKGDFAQAYVIAHEVGHHVQNILGTSEKVSASPRGRQLGATGLSVRLELQADCFAGVWAHSTDQRKLLEAGDVDEALGAAAAVGDDRLQRAATGTVHPETWTHGSSEERSRWFKKGFSGGTIDDCDTFAASTL